MTDNAFQEPNESPDKDAEQAPTNEKLLPNSKVLLAGPTFLAGFAPAGLISLDGEYFSPDVIETFREYEYLRQALFQIVGEANVVVIRNGLSRVKNPGQIKYKTIKSLSDLEYEEIDLPYKGIEQLYTPQPFGWLKNEYTCWPKNAFTVIRGRVFANDLAWGPNIDADRFKGIGDGGTTLCAPNSNIVFLTSKVKKQFPEEVRHLRDLGLTLAELPLASDWSLKRHGKFPEDDIDGFVLPMHDNGTDILYVSKAYYQQSRDTQNLIRASTRASGANLEIVDEPTHLAFNGLPFYDGSVLLPVSSESVLSRRGAKDLGESRVFNIPPLKRISAMGGGSLGCLTGILPMDILLASEG